jgi:hypothetical protein
MPRASAIVDGVHIDAVLSRGDGAYFDTMVDAMARTLGDFLSIKDDELDPKEPYGIVLNDEKDLFPSRKRLDLCAEILRAREFVVEARGIACALSTACTNGSPNVSVKPLTTKRAFMEMQHFHRKTGERVSRLKAGGIGSLLFKQVCKRAEQWLEECDRRLCDAFADYGEEDDASDGLSWSDWSDDEEEMSSNVGLDEPGVPKEPVPGARAAAQAESSERERVVETSPSSSDDDDVEGVRRRRYRFKGNRIDCLVHNLATSIALHVCDVDSSQGAWLCSRALETRAAAEFARTAVHAQRQVEEDTLALSVLEAVARYGVHGEDGPHVLERLRPHLERLLHTPPVELGVHGTGAERMNIALLARALAPELDVEVRTSLVNEWRGLHGAYAASEASQAIARLHRHANSGAPPFIKVLSPPESKHKSQSADGASDGAIRVPRFGFVQENYAWKLATATGNERRTGLDRVGRRIVRLTSLVWELQARGELRCGVVACSLVAPIAVEARCETHSLLHVLEQKLKFQNPGLKLLKFTENVTDSESHLSGAVSSAICRLSKYPLVDLIAIFHHNSKALPLIGTELSRRTRHELLFRMPSNYHTFALDALPVLMPIIHQRRHSLGVSPWRSVDPLVELLRTVARVKTWRPTQGRLVLYSSDLAPGRASPLLKPLLRMMSDKGSSLVRWMRPSVGGRYGSRMGFVFETTHLYRLLGLIDLPPVPTDPTAPDGPDGPAAS